MLGRMRSTATLGLLILMSSAAAADGFEAPILGGTATTVGQYPSVVGINLGGAICSGTLITPEWVLTAAHCVQGIPLSNIKVHFGTVNMFSQPGVVRNAVMAIPKPTFSQPGRNDIGLIKLDHPITDIRPVPVNLDAAKAPVGMKLTMVGFGITQSGTSSSGVQYTVEQTSVSCQTLFGGSNTDLICFSQQNGTGKCSGDSGGPSFSLVDGVLTQVGVTSFGDQNCQYYGADTRTDVEKAFLLQHVPQLECDGDEDCPGKVCFQKRCILAPFTEGGLGSTCSGSADCESGLCAMSDDAGYCSATCAVDNATGCPDGLECLATSDGATGACWPIDDDSGCCDARGTGAPAWLLGFSVVGLILGRKRRRR